MSIEASGDAQLIQDFANTRDRRSFVPRGHPSRDGTKDDLVAPNALEGWLAEHDLLLEGTDLSERDHARVLRLRTALRTALDGNRPAADDPRADPFAVSLRVELDPHQGPRLAPSQTGVDYAIGQLCAAAFRIALTGEWKRLRACAADDCQWIFYDQSRPGRGRYCSPYSCGNRVKTRAYRQRKTQSHSA
ncbi:MAG TPA: CGNR zinc finger domain-containing protein [Nocardioidaceae bacterium]|nr:CGNR zinc finger domain-containing protein [Nocardioidaceae bacterium]